MLIFAFLFTITKCFIVYSWYLGPMDPLQNMNSSHCGLPSSWTVYKISGWVLKSIGNSFYPSFQPWKTILMTRYVISLCSLPSSWIVTDIFRWQKLSSGIAFDPSFLPWKTILMTSRWTNGHLSCAIDKQGLATPSVIPEPLSDHLLPTVYQHSDGRGWIKGASSSSATSKMIICTYHLH